MSGAETTRAPSPEMQKLQQAAKAALGLASSAKTRPLELEINVINQELSRVHATSTVKMNNRESHYDEDKQIARLQERLLVAFDELREIVKGNLANASSNASSGSGEEIPF